ncbi:MAG: diaminopimelate decarboxylase [Opitutales bacterium]|nr:diaminopimelate decarboxylase [Opitutales bacterium]
MSAIAQWIPDFETASGLAREHGTPVFVYDGPTLKAQAEKALAFPNAYGLTVRYAMKAAPNRYLLEQVHRWGLHFDASSGWEIDRLLAAGIEGKKISLSSQELPLQFAHWLEQGVTVNACSLDQLERIGQAAPGSEIGVRINPGLGSGGTNRTNVGGIGSSFGIWHEYIPQILEIAKRHKLTIFRIHTHIGSGSDPAVWQRVARMSLETVARFPDVRVLNLGGGYKVARIPAEKSTDLQEIGAPVKSLFEDFAKQHGRELKLEIEPGTFLVANAGSLLSRIQDVVDTGAEGYRFIKLDSGMTEILRPSLYGAQHPLHIIQEKPAAAEQDYIVVGHCCESGDILTPAPGDPEALQPRRLPESAIGDFCWIGGAGAYCSSMASGNYNSFPLVAEVWHEGEGEFRLIRRRQTLEQILQNEASLEA